MKKVIAVFASIILVIGVYGGVQLKAYVDKQNAAEAARQAAEEQERKRRSIRLDEYDAGPPDPQEILEMVNEERKRVGVAPLQYDENVRMSAQLKADDMVKRNYRQHEIPGTNYTLTREMAYWVDKSCVSSGENIAWWIGADNGTPSSSGAFVSWMSSESHRKAIQDPKYTKTGIGVRNNVVVQRFCVTR